MSKSSIKILGAYGGKGKDLQLSSVQLSKEVILDAGNILEGLGDDCNDVNHVFITHSHLDHIVDLGFLIDSTFQKRTQSLKIYGRKETIENIHKHIFNWVIWPDFTQINLINTKTPSIEFIEIEINEIIEVDGCKIKVIENNHTTSSNGFVIEKNNSAVLFTSDTYCCPNIWKEVNLNKKITAVIVDVSFPSRMEQLAFDSKHLTPSLLKEELKLLTRDNIAIYVNHIKPSYLDELIKEINEADVLLNNGTMLEAQDIVEF